MSFCGLPFEHRDAKAALSKKFEVKGIPCLVMLGPADDNGNRPLINNNIRGYIESGDFSDFPFHKKNYGAVDSADNINDVKSLIIFHENGDDEEQSEIKTLVKNIAAQLK
eukprot:869160_1